MAVNLQVEIFHESRFHCTTTKNSHWEYYYPLPILDHCGLTYILLPWPKGKGSILNKVYPQCFGHSNSIQPKSLDLIIS